MLITSYAKQRGRPYNKASNSPDSLLVNKAEVNQIPIAHDMQEAARQQAPALFITQVRNGHEAEIF